MPKSAEGLPLLGKFILGELIVCASAVTSTVVLMYVHRQMIKRRCTPPFRWNALTSLIKYHNSSIESNERSILADRRKLANKLDNAIGDLQGMILKSCVEHLNSMKSQFWRFQRDILLHDVWNAVFEYVDIILLLFFFSINAVFSFIMFAIVPGE
uniref:Uncharacterized protein n=1 Tax=Plectus sambesii TaxID=2011161 RepID=A0A914UX28_9BILA